MKGRRRLRVGQPHGHRSPSQWQARARAARAGLPVGLAGQGSGFTQKLEVTSWTPQEQVLVARSQRASRTSRSKPAPGAAGNRSRMPPRAGIQVKVGQWGSSCPRAAAIDDMQCHPGRHSRGGCIPRQRPPQQPESDRFGLGSSGDFHGFGPDPGRPRRP